MFAARPLHPRKRTLSGRLVMSQKCHFRTHAVQHCLYSITSWARASRVGYLARRNTIGHQRRWHFRVALAHAPEGGDRAVEMAAARRILSLLRNAWYLSSNTRPNRYSQNSAGTKFDFDVSPH